MAAWRSHAYGSGEVRLERARMPTIRRSDEVLVRVTAASLNPIDLAMLGGYGSRVLNVLRRFEGAEVEFPLVPGRDFSGVVELAGRTAKLPVGTRVWGVLPPHRPGSLAQYVALPQRWAGPAPDALDNLQAAGALYAALTASSALRIAGLTGSAARGAPVLLLGLGGVGQAALQLLVRRGSRVYVSCSGEQADTATALGAVAAFDRHSPDCDERLREASPFEVVLDCGGAGGWEASARPWRFSRYVTLSTPLLRECDERGLAMGTLTAATAFAAQTLAVFRVTAQSPSRALCPPHVRWAYFMPNAVDIEMLRRLADRGEFKVQVERVFPWQEAPAAFEHLAKGHARGKVVLDFAAQPNESTPPV
ncbi:unnamed protein product [Leptosia nina]|uniref:Enoyl reductase (ER) domain-containing protein n=1 Tax=Leptosia nina TaxID=320188 RepID=A0AAV1JS07_9NEOP